MRFLSADNLVVRKGDLTNLVTQSNSNTTDGEQCTQGLGVRALTGVNSTQLSETTKHIAGYTFPGRRMAPSQVVHSATPQGSETDRTQLVGKQFDALAE